MEKRKNPGMDLRKQSGLFFQIGLLSALMLVVSAFEYKTPMTYKPVDITGPDVMEEAIIPLTTQDPPPPPPKPKPIIVNPVEALPTEPEPEEREIIIDPSQLEDIIPEIVPDPLPVELAPEFRDYAEQMPAPVGGYEVFYKFISKNIEYPYKAKKLGIDGKVFVQFIIDENGKITNIKTIKGAGAGLNKEAERVLSLAPDWIPGKQGGRRVKVRMIIPIIFHLNQ